MNISNLANQLNVAATDSGLGQGFYLALLKSATVAQVESYAQAIPVDTEFLQMLRQSLDILAQDKKANGEH